ncbi:peptidoglycan editing factor PgeF [Pseudoalteromonas xiamenensis]|uniref:Purine nucleoside phosphorylase n=1 Tax=Pseudoalteromonas xiamenensis TaxID=882626 RepID=A0A975DHX8_9GAMM|nr:peptidoglycan editing factor PgeF [Pseudoalteromonas xiamenensis]QTH71884.1 peptidoglycan editing factor PgeF [Pseudoalteromonas xiamenensis]
MFLEATWPLAPFVGGFCTVRHTLGVSQTPFDKFNVAYHVGDNADHVAQNRRTLDSFLPRSPIWLNQVHGGRVVDINESNISECANNQLDADGLFTRLTNTPLAIMTADCLPILLSNEDGSEVAALHGGWRPLHKNIIKQALRFFESSPEHVSAWFGPAIGPKAFEVGLDVVEAFCNDDPNYKGAFVRHPDNEDKWLANIFTLARMQLLALGVKNIYSDDLCTVEDKTRFFSYRRDKQTGRMVSVIWRKYP